ncbi:MAG: rhodanese-related sulfurtransferase [Zoogloeaceae bacterium]|jgi:rhodanese-related sulfurtransferase|nr:rhodanese-related sulfurtransferase [Zoogloeaceae bacterium]
MRSRANPPSPPYVSYETVRAALLDGREIALIDAREEAPHAEGHPLFAAQISLSRLELEAYAKIPRLDVPVVALDGGNEGIAERAAQKLLEMGYSDVSVLAGGAAGWQSAGGELFRDVNAPSKAFGELLDAVRRTPSLEAGELNALLNEGAEVVVLDARRFDEYQTMNIPGSVSVPGEELVLRAPELAPNPNTRIVVNCAGRTRSILGAQSLLHAGLPNPIAALRNGVIGWTLAGQSLEYGANRRGGQIQETTRAAAAQRARAVADQAGVKRVALPDIESWHEQRERTTYFVDVRDPAEYEAGSLPGFRSVPGGQLVQETDMTAAVRGARFVLADNDGVRANMTASWLAQMAWEVYVLDPPPSDAMRQTGAWRPKRAPLPETPRVSAETLARWLRLPDPPVVIDLTTYASYRRGHIPGAWYMLRARYSEDISRLPRASRYVLTCSSGLLGYYSHHEFAALTKAEVFALDGGTNSWQAIGQPLETTERLASPRIDRYRRPYEGTDASAETTRAYLAWEYGLVEQLARDGTHRFNPLRAKPLTGVLSGFTKPAPSSLNPIRQTGKNMTTPPPFLPFLEKASEQDIAAGLAALDEFIAAFNARDSARWSRTLHYPHVRFAGDEIRIWDSPEAYARDNEIALLAEKTHWSHSRWDYRHLLHGSGEKLHFALQFTRYDVNDQPQGSYQAIYVLTRAKEGAWGVQARSSYAGIAVKGAAF